MINNLDVTTGALACPNTRLLAPLAHSLALHCSLCSHAALHLFFHSLAHSLPSSWESELLMSPNDLVLSHSAETGCGGGGDYGSEQPIAETFNHSGRASEWPSTYVLILGCSESKWRGE